MLKKRSVHIIHLCQVLVVVVVDIVVMVVIVAIDYLFQLILFQLDVDAIPGAAKGKNEFVGACQQCVKCVTSNSHTLYSASRVFTSL